MITEIFFETSHKKNKSSKMLKKKFRILNVRKYLSTPAIALKLIKFPLTMNWGGGGV